MSDAASETVHAIDLEPFRLGSDADRRAVARQIDEACRGTGFLRVSGHGVPADTVARMLDVSSRFFALPVEEKERYFLADRSVNRGYSGVGSEALAYSTGTESPPDLFEAFNVGREDIEGDWYDRARAFYPRNVWPDRPADLRATWLEYLDATGVLSGVLLRAFALALDLPEGWFVDRATSPMVTMRAINYERRPGSPDPTPDQMRMGAHSDYGVLTVLLADDVPGLQVFHDGTWHDVRTPPGTFIVNIGDMLAQWTNDRWRSTVHRVVPPPADADGPVRRRSVARFLEPDFDTVVSCIPSCCSADDPPRYPPVTAGDYLLAKILGPRALQPSEDLRATG